jgi:ubiquinone/menaquinone biosynthesis C-methylase UbiE|tara:strand:- start:10172 stop:10855 length:684 start_codon:yes stop_codon:yes gene_type:complete
LKIIKENYWVELPIINSFLRKLLLKNRLKIFDLFMNKLKPSNETKILDVGTTPVIEDGENIILNNYQWVENISSISNQDCSLLNKKYKNCNFYLGDAKKMEFNDNTFDIVHCSATIEHVGNRINQKKVISELYRVCKNHVFLTTPNKYFPIEMHTKIPFLHYLPKKIYRVILKIIGLNFYSLEENLNLLNTSDLKKMCNELKIKRYNFYYNKLLFMKSNIILVISKS